MKIDNAENFWHVFANELRLQISETSDWKTAYYKDKYWTCFMTDLMDKIGRSNGYTALGEVSHEYFRLDVIFSKWCPDRRSWDLDVAIELENNPRTWYDEFSKLCHINCGLRVIVTYDDFKQPLEEQVSRAVEIAKMQRYKSQSARWLLIFGPTGQPTEIDGKPWRAFLIENDKPTELAKNFIFTPNTCITPTKCVVSKSHRLRLISPSS